MASAPRTDRRPDPRPDLRPDPSRPALVTDRRRGLAVRGLAVVAVAAALTGCSATNQITTNLEYASSDGIRVEMGDLIVSNLMILSGGEGEEGLVLGGLANDSGEDVTWTLALTDDPEQTVSVDVPAGGTALFGPGTDTELTLDSVPEPPGALAEVRLSSPATGQVSARVPILDGTLPPYDEYVPAAEG